MIALIVLCSAVIAGAIGVQIGGLRGRTAAGFVWGFLLGPIGWLIVLTGPDQRPTCAECGGVVVAGSRRCKHCGAERFTRSETQRATESPLESSSDTVPISSGHAGVAISDRLFDIELEGDPGHPRPMVVLNCLACGNRPRIPLPREKEGLHRLSCECGFSVSVSSEELIAETLEVGARLGDRLADRDLDTGS